jgi:hypothetical protein
MDLPLVYRAGQADRQQLRVPGPIYESLLPNFAHLPDFSTWRRTFRVLSATQTAKHRPRAASLPWREARLFRQLSRGGHFEEALNARKAGCTCH